MSNQCRLIPVSYYNASQEVRLSAYADTIVYEQESDNKRILQAIRFGGYPEVVRGLADAIYAGAAPVSYTHLDVYKRQPHDYVQFRLRDLSETHLGKCGGSQVLYRQGCHDWLRPLCLRQL